MFKNIFIPHCKSDFEFITKIKDFKKKFNILPLSPEFYDQSIKKGFLKITFKPNYYLKENYHRQIVKIIINTDRYINSNLKLNNFEKDAFKPLAHAFLSSSFFIWYSLGDTKTWFYCNGKELIKSNDKKEIFNATINNLFKNYHEDCYGQISNFRYSSIRILNFFINKLIILNLPKNITLINSKKFEPLINKKTLLIKKPSGLYLLKNIKNFFFNIFSRRKSIIITPYDLKETKSFDSDILKIFNYYISIFDIDNFLIKKLNYYINYNYSIYKTIKTLFKSKNIDFFVSDELKFREPFVIGNYIKNKYSTKKTYLASHGIHSLIHKDKISNFQILQNANGLLFSKLSNNYIIQSKISYEFIKSIKPQNKKIIISSPISWSSGNIKNFKQNKKFLTLLHASTPKTFCSRPYMYESPYEYIESLNYIIMQIKYFKNVKLKIRLRETPECDYAVLKNLIKFNNQCTFSDESNFYNDLSCADALISYSSTTIEESLMFRKPVIIFNSLGFNHFQSIKINSKSPVFIISKNRFRLRMKKALHYISNANKLYFNYENFVWKYQNIERFKIN